MNVYENTRLDDWLDIHHPSCDVRHMQRGCKTLPELLYWLSNNLYVNFTCDNINCKYHWKIYKSVFFIDNDSVITYLKCPVCKKLSVTATWGYFTEKLLAEYNCQHHYWSYNVNTFEWEFVDIGDEHYSRFPKPRPDHMEEYFFGVILHSHQQFLIRTEGNHFF